MKQNSDSWAITRFAGRPPSRSKGTRLWTSQFLSDEERHALEDKSIYAFPLTPEQVVDAIGLTPALVNRSMQQLRTEGLIVTETGE